MANEKIYYSVYTLNEKIWIKADFCDITDGCLVFSDYDDTTNTKVVIAAFPANYWKYVYEADLETGESINAQIPFWKRHPKHDEHHETPYENYRGEHSRDSGRDSPPYRKFGNR